MKTWSEFGDLGRKPTQYEVVTHGMNHTASGRGLELGPEVHGNVWLREHRDNMGITADWEAFRDPDELTYDRYVTLQDTAETYVDGVIARFDESTDSDAGAPADRLDLLARAMAPTRYLSHVEMMLSSYLQQLAPSAYVANCASFQTADQLRRTQRIAERTRMLQLVHPDRGFGENERTIWEEDELWQPIRRSSELALVRYDWDQALIATNVVVKPIADQLFLAELAVELRAVGAELDALIAENLLIDAERSQRWTSALIAHLLAAKKTNKKVLTGHLADWRDEADAVIAAGSTLLATAGNRSADEISQSSTTAWKAFLASTGLGK